MSSKTPPEDLAVLVRLLQAWNVQTQDDFATSAGITSNTVTSYRNGKTSPNRAMVVRLARAAKVPLSVVDTYLLPAIAAARAPEEHGDDPLESLVQRFARQGQGLGSRLAEALLTLGKTGKTQRWPPAEVLRKEALERWSLLAECDDEDRASLVEAWAEFQHPGLAELLCHLSEDAASDRADRALTLAKLAHRISVLVPGESAKKKDLEGYALLFLANAVRVSGDLRVARKTFNEGLALWSGASSLLAKWRVLDLEASLLRDERSFKLSLARLQDALTLAPSEEGRLLLKLAFTLEQMGEGELALEALNKAESLIDPEREPRHFLILRFNRATVLCLLDRFEESEQMLPEIHARAAELQLELDNLRVQWLKGRVAAGRGRLDEAAAYLEEVRQSFTNRQSAWDCSLVTLELATVRLRQDRTEDVRFLAGELVWIFEAQGIHREALAALTLFREAAERDLATVDLTERLVRYLRKAQGDPDLRFGA